MTTKPSNAPELPVANTYMVTMKDGRVRGYYEDELTAIALSMPDDTIMAMYKESQIAEISIAFRADGVRK